MVSKGENETREFIIETSKGRVAFEYNEKNLTGELIAIDNQGNESRVEAAYGVDRVIPAYPGFSAGYFVVTTGREADRLVSFDKVHHIFFDESGPVIRTVISESGFGGYTDSEWVYIPEVTDQKNLILKRIEAYNDFPYLEEWKVGLALTSRSDWKKEYTLASVRVLDSSEVIVEFAGGCDNNSGKPPICGRYLLHTPTKTITPVPVIRY